MRIEAVITCDNYGDFLAHTLPINVEHLDHIVVVTSHEDKATRDLCNHYGVSCVQSDVHKEYGDTFNKGRLINVGLGHLRQDDWILHLDADVILPHRFRYTFDTAQADKACIYGADRLHVKNFDLWKEVQPKLIPQFNDGCHVVPHGALPLGSRLLHGDYGYCPIGYFQLWHSSSKENRQYPGCAGSSEHSDVLFAIQWPRLQRRLLPQMFVYHLDCENAPMGLNWKGRKSPAFCPCHSYMLPVHMSWHRHHKHHHPPHRRHHHHHHKPYKPC